MVSQISEQTGKSLLYATLSVNKSITGCTYAIRTDKMSFKIEQLFKCLIKATLHPLFLTVASYNSNVIWTNMDEYCL